MKFYTCYGDTVRFLLLLGALGASDALGPPVRHEGFQMSPPRAFHMARLDLFHGTHVGGVGGASYLAAALVDGEGEDAASLLLSVVEAPFSIGPGVRDSLATDVAKHFKDELDQRFVLERADVVNGPGARVEVRGTVRAGSQARQILVAAFPGDVRHTVAVFSVPTGRWDDVRASITDSLDSYRFDTPQGALTPRRWGLGAATLFGALLIVSIGLWRRRRADREARIASGPR